MRGRPSRRLSVLNQGIQRRGGPAQQGALGAVPSDATSGGIAATGAPGYDSGGKGLELHGGRSSSGRTVTNTVAFGHSVFVCLSPLDGRTVVHFISCYGHCVPKTYLTNAPMCAVLQALLAHGRNPNLEALGKYQAVVNTALGKSQATGSIAGKCTAMGKFLEFLQESDLTLRQLLGDDKGSEFWPAAKVGRLGGTNGGGNGYDCIIPSPTLTIRGHPRRTSIHNFCSATVPKSRRRTNGRTHVALTRRRSKRSAVGFTARTCGPKRSWTNRRPSCMASRA